MHWARVLGIGAWVIGLLSAGRAGIAGSAAPVDAATSCTARSAWSPASRFPADTITISGTVHGHPAGVSSDLQDTLDFAALQRIKPMVEVLPLEKAADGYQRMMANQARFRVVLTTAA